jgi:hypothetical protein
MTLVLVEFSKAVVGLSGIVLNICMAISIELILSSV